MGALTTRIAWETLRSRLGSTFDIDVCPAGSFWLYDESRYIPGVSPMPALPQGTQIFVKGAVAGTGTIYLVTQYLITA